MYRLFNGFCTGVPDNVRVSPRAPNICSSITLHGEGVSWLQRCKNTHMCRPEKAGVSWNIKAVRKNTKTTREQYFFWYKFNVFSHVSALQFRFVPKSLIWGPQSTSFHSQLKFTWLHHKCSFYKKVITFFFLRFKGIFFIKVQFFHN